MPGPPTSIVVGGGINGVAPLVVDNFLFLSNVTPPEASTSPRLIRRATSIEILGDGALSTAIGNNADANGAENIVIGQDSSSVGGGSPSDIIAIGQNMRNTGPVGEAILIGHDVGSNGTSLIVIGSVDGGVANFNNAVCIGHSLSFSGSVNGVAIGFDAGTTGANAVAIGGSGARAGTSGTAVGSAASALGSNAIAIGQGCDGTGTSSGNIQIGVSSRLTNTSNVILIGHNLRTDNSTFAAGDICIGNNNVGGLGFSSRLILFGEQHTSGVAVPASAIRFKNAQGTDIAAGDVTITAPRSTGNAAPASIVWQAGATGASGAALQTATTVARVVGAAAPHFEITPNRGLAFVNQVDSAGVAAGTLTNAPAAGDPAFWLPVIINGVSHAIPAWLG